MTWVDESMQKQQAQRQTEHGCDLTMDELGVAAGTAEGDEDGAHDDSHASETHEDDRGRRTQAQSSITTLPSATLANQDEQRESGDCVVS